MPSIPARMINQYLIRKMKSLPLANMEPTKVREIFAKAPQLFLPSDVRRDRVEADGPKGTVKGEWHLAPTVDPLKAYDKTILYFHGGGYVFGSPSTHRTITFSLARRTQFPVFSLDYRLAPEDPCPAAIDDAEAAYHWLLSLGKKPEEIVIGGDSAGGGLTLSLLQRLVSTGTDVPAAAFLYSPWTDLTCSGASIDENNASDVMFQADHMRRGTDRYAGSLEKTDPRVSPLFGEMKGLPPLLVYVSASEMLRDDSVRFVEKAKAAGVEVEFHLGEQLAHVWPVFTPIMPEANEAVARTAAFIREPSLLKAA
ncbi:MAG: alpha/beta hydrolase [Pseudomonadota bacterium]